MPAHLSRTPPNFPQVRPRSTTTRLTAVTGLIHPLTPSLQKVYITPTAATTPWCVRLLRCVIAEAMDRPDSTVPSAPTTAPPPQPAQQPVQPDGRAAQIADTVVVRAPGDPPRDQNSRRAAACLVCRRSKIKCEKGRGGSDDRCHRCLQLGVQCIRPDFHVGRRKGVKKSGFLGIFGSSRNGN